MHANQRLRTALAIQLPIPAISPVPPDTREKPRLCRPLASAWELRSTCRL